ncbi:pyridoxamine 5'-phosphate oxidase family protein [Candidatus Roizmanbacteria bacterium]|nr:pyridoxamine 5'-phosphate oxidase family protein [Candidatus Roizmanbacteria bacterium]
MDKTILDFLEKNRVGVLATLLLDGTPHGAALHYSFKIDPLELYFSVDKMSRKCKGLIERKEGKASIVIGFSEEDWLTLQVEGTIRIVDNPNTIKEIKKVHYVRHPNSLKFENDPNTVFLLFRPTWLRYTDFNTEPPKIILTENF